MAENLGRINPVPRHFLDRNAREEPYPGRHPRKNSGHPPIGLAADPENNDEEEQRESAAMNHIDLRI